MRHWMSLEEGERYVAQYHMEKWMNQCLRCQVRGLKPETPQPELGNHRSHKWRHVRGAFRELPLVDGLCPDCQP